MRTSPSLLNMCIKSCQLEDLTDLTTKMMKKKPHGCLRIFALEGESVVASSGSPLRGMILASNEATARACKWLGRHSVSLWYLSLSAEFTIGGFSISAKEKTKSGKQTLGHYHRVNLEKKTISPAISEVVRFGDNTGQNSISTHGRLVG